MEEQNVDLKIINALLIIGLSPNLKGYHLIKDAVKLTISDVNYIQNITKKLYPELANSNHCNPQSVERAIRHALEVAYNRGRLANLNEYFKMYIFEPNQKPTNGEFLSILAEKIYGC